MSEVRRFAVTFQYVSWLLKKRLFSSVPNSCGNNILEFQWKLEFSALKFGLREEVLRKKMKKVRFDRNFQ